MTATFAAFETSCGAKIHRIPLQAFPGFWAYVYVLSMDGQHILIDAGSGTDASHDDLLDGLGQAELETSDLTHILLTHAHIDHYGGLWRLKSLTEAKMGCHTLDLQTVAHHEGQLALTSHRLASFLADCGLDTEVTGSLLNLYRLTKTISRSVPMDFTYETLHEHVPAMEVIHLPGHCPGHVALKFDDIVFCGDMVVEGVTPHLTPGYVHSHGGLDLYLESLSRFQAWAAGIPLILNGHDDIITDLPSQVTATRRNIIRRIRRALDALRIPLTISEVCAIVYENPEGYNKFLTIEKTGAYIEYLYEHAMIRISNPNEVEKGLPARFAGLGELTDDEILPTQKITTRGSLI